MENFQMEKKPRCLFIIVSVFSYTCTEVVLNNIKKTTFLTDYFQGSSLFHNDMNISSLRGMKEEALP